MIFTPLPLEGAYEISIEPRVDARGFFARIFCRREFRERGLNADWEQVNTALSAAAGTLRGLHFQRAPDGEAKLVRVLRGKALDVVVDLRGGSASRGRHAAVTLDAEARNAVYVPEGFAHGYQTLTEDCELQYFCSASHAPESEGGLQALDPALGIRWPLPVSARSKRDIGLPPLYEVRPL